MKQHAATYLRNPQWDHPKKVESRRQTVILPYRQHFQQRLPLDQQYWTMCGAHFDRNGESIQGELGQLLKEGLIEPEQFHGVDRESEIINHNIALHPDVRWHLGDFRQVMEQAAIDNAFNPGIINYDGVMQVRLGSRYLKSIMQLVDHNAPKPVLLVANFLMNNPYCLTGVRDAIEIIRELEKVYIFPDHWSLQPWCYVYFGTGNKSRTWMCSLVFIKQEHDPDDLSFTKGRRLDLPIRKGDMKCLQVESV